MTQGVAAPQEPRETHTWTDPTGRTWQLDHDFLDWHMGGWEWNGKAIDPVHGPMLHTTTGDLRSERLLALANCAGLRQLTLADPADPLDLAHYLDPIEDNRRRQLAAGGTT